jgi:hypothetical protein
MARSLARRDEKSSKHAMASAATYGSFWRTDGQASTGKIHQGREFLPERRERQRRPWANFNEAYCLAKASSGILASASKMAESKKVMRKILNFFWLLLRVGYDHLTEQYYDDQAGWHRGFLH